MTTPDVRVRLSPEGIQEVIHAFRQIEEEGGKAGKGLTGIFAKLKKTAGELGVSLPALGAAGVVGGLVKLGKEGLAVSDSMGKIAQKTGSAVEGLSVLAVAGEGANVSTERLQDGLTKLAINVQKLRDGNAEAGDSFKQIGLGVKDFEGLSTDQAFVKVANAVGRFEATMGKTAATAGVLGKGSADLIPLLNDVAQNGFGALTERARELNLVIDEDMAASAAAVNDSFTAIGQQTKGLAVQFASGFAPAVAQAMTNFSDSVKGGGDQMKSFGKFVGKTIGLVVNIFVAFKNVVTNIFKTIGDAIGGLFATIGALVQGNFAEAGEIFKSTFVDAFDNVAGTLGQFQQDLGKLLFDVIEDVPPVELKVRVDTQELADIEKSTEKADRERAEREAKRAADTAKRKAEAEAREQERLARQRADFEAKILELQGKRREAALRSLDEEARKLDDILKKQGVADAERLAKLEQFRSLSVAQIDAAEQLAAAERVLDQLGRERQSLENQVALGQIGQIDAQNQLKTIEAQRLVTLQQMAAAALAAAQATGDPEAIARAQALTQEVQNLQVKVNETGLAFGRMKDAAIDSGAGQVVTLFDAATRQQQDFGDAARAAALSVVDSIRQIAAELLKAQIVKYLTSLFGAAGSAGSAAGSALAAAGGGFVSGAGTATSDSIPARLSNGEFVVRAAAVRQPGVLEALHRLNRGMGSPRAPGRQRFASGGQVAASQPAAQQGGGSSSLRIVNVLDATMVTDALSSPAGERTIMNQIKRNAGSLRKIFGG